MSSKDRRTGVSLYHVRRRSMMSDTEDRVMFSTDYRTAVSLDDTLLKSLLWERKDRLMPIMDYDVGQRYPLMMK